jgi:crotonobetainyl-CoA:carnitine CoA-transferase CaiB-like acyl-CoA transferase
VHRNPNKLSVTLDLSTERGKDLCKRLATVCDVLIENFRASVMDRLGLGYGVMSQVNPHLIYLKISGQGATGPERDYGSLGSTLEQTAGLASVTGYEDRRPSMTNETYPDPVGGIFNVGLLMGALRRRRKTGQGGFIDFSQREMTASMLGQEFLDFSFNGRVAEPMGNRHPAFEPQGVYPCMGDDMWVAISVGSEEEWVGLCDAVGMPQLAHNPRFETALARRRNRDELERYLNNWTREQDHYEAMHTLQKNGVPAGAVLKGGEIIDDPHLEERGFWDDVHHPEAGSYRQVTTPWAFSKTGRIQTTPAPGLGEHNEYVLSELLGLTSRELDDLEEKGVIGTIPIGAE